MDPVNMSTQDPTENRDKFATRKFRYFALLLALTFGAVLLAFSFWSSAVPNDSSRIKLFGKWVGTAGNTMKLLKDGTAIGTQAGSAEVGHYRWSVSAGMITFTRVQNAQGLKGFIRKIAVGLPYGASGDEYEITNLTDDSLTLLDIQTNKPLLLKRSED